MELSRVGARRRKTGGQLAPVQDNVGLMSVAVPLIIVWEVKTPDRVVGNASKVRANSAGEAALFIDTPLRDRVTGNIAETWLPNGWQLRGKRWAVRVPV
jgi:hypothetical protein